MNFILRMLTLQSQQINLFEKYWVNISKLTIFETLSQYFKINKFCNVEPIFPNVMDPKTLHQNNSKLHKLKLKNILHCLKRTNNLKPNKK